MSALPLGVLIDSRSTIFVWVRLNVDAARRRNKRTRRREEWKRLKTLKVVGFRLKCNYFPFLEFLELNTTIARQTSGGG